jgi:p-hydroxybenzoate 3-monooxygenase
MVRHLQTQVAIVGAGPAGLVLSHLLAARGIDSVVLEDKTRDYVEQRVRAGVLEHPSVELLRHLGLAGRLDREGLVHRGIELAFSGGRHRIDFVELTGRWITVYGQQEVVKDLIGARLGAGLPICFEVADVTLRGIDSDRPAVDFVHADERYELSCDFVAGCDGFHGICRPSIPADVLTIDEREYPFAWLGILARARPTTDELIYSGHDRGFCLYSMRSPEVTRLYLQVPPDEDLAHWPEERIWSELTARLPTDLGFELVTGPILEQGITAMRSFVASPMRHDRLFLAGDAAHIVPPTGAKGMNLAIADVTVLAAAVDEYYRSGQETGLEAYSSTCARRVWRVQHFSWWMTSMLHRFDEHDRYQRQLQLSELAYVTASRAASTALAENYVGLPFAADIATRHLGPAEDEITEPPD